MSLNNRSVASNLRSWILVWSLLLLAQIAQAAPQPIVLRLMYSGDFSSIEVNELMIHQFERLHPGIIIRGERTTAAGTEYVQKLLLEKAAGLTPDVIFSGDTFSQLAARGLFMNIRPVAEHDPTMSLAAYYPKLLSVFERGNMLYALPHDVAPTGIIYFNKSLFDKAGIPYPDGTWSWDYKPHPERGNKDFLTVCEKLTHHASTEQDSVYGFGTENPDWTMENFTYSSGADFVDDIYKPTKLLYGDPRVVKAIQLTSDLAQKYDVSPSNVDILSSGVTSHELFDQGKIAMYMGGIWESERFRPEIKNFDWDVTSFPASPTGSKSIMAAYSGYGISATTAHPKEAWEFLKYLTGPIGQATTAATGVSQPGLMYLANSKVWLDGKRPKHRIVTIEETPGAHYGILYYQWTQIFDQIVDPKLQLVWNGTLTAQEAVDQFLGPAQKKLDDLNHPSDYPKLDWRLGFLAMLAAALLLFGWVWQGVAADLKSTGKLGRKSEALAGYLFVSPWIIGGLVFLAIPMLFSLLLAFSSWDLLTPATWVGLGNFREMATDDLFWKSLSVTGLYTLFSVPLGIVGSLSLALLLHTKIRGQGVFRTLFYLPAVASTVAASLIWMRLLNPESGLINYVIGLLHLNPVFQFLGLTDPSKGYVDWLGSEKTALASIVMMSLWGVGGGMVIYLAGLQGIPQSYYEAADIDGASVVQKFWNVTLPLLTPTIFFTLIIGVIAAFQIFTQGFMMTQSPGAPNNATLFFVLYLYQNAFSFLKIGYASAMAWVLFIIILLFTLLQFKMSTWVHYESAGK
jgi:ABC-type sugar transport system permease subunit/ABC-type glycerol-3-phosphate transport system substrate-binding protein